MSDLIDRQAAIDDMNNMYQAAEKWGREAADDVIKARAESCMATLVEMKLRIEQLPSVHQTLYGYRIELLAFIAGVMHKKNLTPEKAIECFEDIEKIVQIIMDEQKEIIRQEFENYGQL